MSEFDIDAISRELDAGGDLTPDQVAFYERCLVQAANESRRIELAALEAGQGSDVLREQETRRNLLRRLDAVRRRDGAIGYPTSRELVPYRLGRDADLLSDARPDEVNLGRERRLGSNAAPSPL